MKDEQYETIVTMLTTLSKEVRVIQDDIRGVQGDIRGLQEDVREIRKENKELVERVNKKIDSSLAEMGSTILANVNEVFTEWQRGARQINHAHNKRFVKIERHIGLV